MLDSIPFFTTLTVGKFVRFLISNELFFFRIPDKFPTEFVSDITELAKGRSTVTCFDMGHGHLSAVNTVDPVIMMILGLA